MATDAPQCVFVSPSAVLSSLLAPGCCQQVQIIQRDHRIQLGEAYIFPRWHPEAAASREGALLAASLHAKVGLLEPSTSTLVLPSLYVPAPDGLAA